MSSLNLQKALVKSFSYKSLVSTQDEAARLLKMGEAPPFYVHAHHQTGGRGRLNRHWICEEGASLALTYCCRSTSDFVSGLSLVVGISVVAATQRADLKLKWPNDLMLGASKVGGILVESKSQGGTIDFLIGVGLNLKSLKGAGYNGLNQEVLPQDLIQHIHDDLQRFFVSGFDEFRETYESKMWMLGEEVVYEVRGQRQQVKVLGVNEDGALRIASGGSLVLNVDGEILHDG